MLKSFLIALHTAARTLPFYHKHYSTALATTDCHFEVDEKRQRALKEKSLLTASQQ